MQKNKYLIKPIIHTSDISRRSQIILLVLRSLAILGIITFFIVWLFTDRTYMKWFFSGLAIICFIIPELTAELLIRDYPNRGIRNISNRARLLFTPLIYGVFLGISPVFFHTFFDLFSRPSRTMGGNISSLQIGIWQSLFSSTSYCSPISLIGLVIFPILLLSTTVSLCYLTSSASWRRRVIAIILFILFEFAAAFAACNSPG